VREAVAGQGHCQSAGGQCGNGCYTGPSIIVTWCIGHLIEAAPPEAYGEQYKRWSIEQLPILPERWRSEVKAATATQFKAVKHVIGQASELVIATDADREGKMIAREVLDLCGYRGPVQRLWLGFPVVDARPANSVCGSVTVCTQAGFSSGKLGVCFRTFHVRWRT
jgi:hypothetical protein